MYNDDYKLSSKAANKNRAFVEAAISSYEEKNKAPKTNNTRNFQEDTDMVIERTMRRDGNIARYQSFVESVKSTLVLECMYNMLEGAIPNNKKDLTNTAILRAMCSQYIKENGYDNILFKMKNGSVALSKMYGYVNEHATRILEGVDKEDPNTFVITPEMKDEFFKSLDYSDSEAISDAIRDRVSTAMDDFVTANTKDHEDIEDALKQAQEKIEKNAGDDEALAESYNIQAKRNIAKIKNAPKGVLHCMVSSMCESVLKNQKEYAEFMTEGHVNVGKVIDRISLMYTFMEMLNTSRLEKVDNVFIENVINDLKA